MRMTASWSGSKRTYRIQVCGAKMRPNGELPSDHYAGQAPSDVGVRREKPISLFIVPPRAQASRRCKTTSDAKAASRQAPLAFRSLDPFRALRELDRRRRDEERPFPVGSRTGAPVGRDIPTVPRFQPPPRRTQHADFPHCAPPFASLQGLWDLSCRGNFRSVVSHSIAVEQS